MPRDERRPHIVAAPLHQVLKLHFALLVEFVLHLGCAAGESLRTDAQVLTWRRQKHGVPFLHTSVPQDSVFQKAELSLWSKLSCDFGALITEAIKEGQSVTNGEG